MGYVSAIAYFVTVLVKVMYVTNHAVMVMVIEVIVVVSGCVAV